MKKSLLSILLILVFAAVTHAGNDTIRFGILPALDTLPLQVAVKDGLFRQQGLDVELVPFSSALERDTAMQTGRLDGYFGDLVATYLLINQNIPMNIALVSWRTTPGFPMFGIARSPAAKEDSLADMKGKTFGLSKSTIMEFLADAISKKLALTPQYFKRTEIKKIPVRLQMLLTDMISAALLPEPLLSLAQSRGSSILATAEDLDMPLTVLCLHHKYFQNGAETYARFLTAYREAVRRLRTAPETYRTLMAQTCRIPKSLADNFPVYPYPMPSLPTDAELKVVQDWMIQKGLLKNAIPTELVLAPSIP